MAEVAHFPFLAIMVILMIVIPEGLAADDPDQLREVGEGCNPNNVSDTAFTAFSGNRDSVLASLSSNLTPELYANNNDGNVYALAVCRKYLTRRQCSKCITEAVSQLKELCSRSLGGRIYLDGCFVRYENSYNFYDQYVDAGNSSSCPSSTNSSDPLFSERAQTLSTQLMKNASANNGYTFGSINGSLYGLAQCWPQLSNKSCQICLNDTRNLLLKCTPISEGRGLEAGCFMRYSTYMFYNHTKDPGNSSSSKLVAILLPSIGGAVLIAVVCLVLFCTRSRQWKSYIRAGEISNPLSWENRLKIIEGTARGLAYLHEDANERIIHRDIKCANILLDERFHPKIADFGLARFFPEGQTHVSTSRFGGTRGYAAPEYAIHGQLSEKADVYSYGIVVLEIVSGRKCLDYRLPEPLQILLQWAWNKYEHDEALDIVDSTLEGQHSREQVLRIISIAFLCTQGSSTRPAMSHVLRMLNNDGDIPVQPTQPPFIDAATTSRPANSNAASNSESSAPDPSHGSITVSLSPR